MTQQTTIPTDMEQVALAIFDSYCKTIIRNEGRNQQRGIWRRNSREVVSEDITQYDPTMDTYPSDLHVLMVADSPCFIQDEGLYHAMCTLPEKHRIAFMMHFWCNKGDGEISAHFERTTRTIRRWRRTSLAQIQEQMLDHSKFIDAKEEPQT